MSRSRRSQRPRTRGDCLDSPRPCPWVGCRHHLYLEVRGTQVALNFPGREPGDLTESCSLDVAEDGPHTAVDVGAALGLAKPSALANEYAAIEKLRRHLPLLQGAA